MSADKYPSICSRQMKAIVYLFLPGVYIFVVTDLVVSFKNIALICNKLSLSH